MLNRKLKSIDYSALMVYHGLIGGILSAIYILIEAAINGGNFRFYTLQQYLILAGAATFDAMACFSMTIAYQSDNSGFVSLLGYAIILYGFLSDVLIFDESI